MFHVKHFKKEVKRFIKRAHIKIGDEEIGKISQYYQELCRWNQHINLVSRQDIPFFIKKHLYPAFVLANSIKGRGFILDYGSGGGVVGIPLAIILKNVKIYLLESKMKKCVFLRHIAKTLSLPIVVFEGNSVKFKEYYNKFDYILVRGLNLRKEMFLFLKGDGWLIHIGRTKSEKGFSCKNQTVMGIKFLWCRDDNENFSNYKMKKIAANQKNG